MTNRRLQTLIVILVVIGTVYAQEIPGSESSYFSANALLPIDDPIVDAVGKLYAEHGLVLPLAVQPWTVAQALAFLERLQQADGTAAWNAQIVSTIFTSGKEVVSHLSEADMELIEALRRDLYSRIIVSESGFSFDAEVRSAFEVYGVFSPSGSESIVPWEYGWADRQPLAMISLRGAWGADPDDYTGFGIWGGVDFAIKEEHNAIERLVDPANVTNFPEEGTYIDYQFPFRALISTGAQGWNVTLGRDKIDLGNGSAGNLGVSDAADFYDFMRLQLGGSHVNYTGLWLSLDPSLDGLPGAIVPDPEDIRSLQKNAFIHRLDLSFWDKVHVGLTEGIMVGGVEPGLKYLNPFILFHNLFPWLDTPELVSASSLLGVEVTANPLTWMTLWYQYVQNQYQGEFELENYPDAADKIPNANAWLAGVKLVVPIEVPSNAMSVAPISQQRWFEGTGPVYISASFEYVETNPWMYVRENALNSWFWRRRLTSNIPGSFRFVNTPMGWHLGPDNKTTQIRLGLEQYGLFTASIGYENRTQGEQTIFTPYEEGNDAVGLKTPTGTPELTHIVSFSGELWFSRRPDVGIGLDLNYLTIENWGHISGEYADSLQIVFGLRLKL